MNLLRSGLAVTLFAGVLVACEDGAPTGPVEPGRELTAGPRVDSIAPLYEMHNLNRLPGRYVVRFKEAVKDARALSAALIAQHGGRVYKVLQGLKGFWGELPESAIVHLRRNPSVAYIEADVAVPVSGVGDTIQRNWPLDRIDQRILPLDGAYEYSVVGSGVRIWIIDTGVDRSEPELAGRIDQSSYFTYNYKDPYAPCSPHGTDVAVVAAGRVSGVAKAAIVHSARVDTDDCLHLSTGASSAAFEFIADYSPRPAVINYSAGRRCHWLFGCGQGVDDAAKYARQKGVTVVVSAGNDGSDACDQTPAHVRELITVASSNSNDERWDFSNWGSCVDRFAPVASGYTSFAAPMVTGVAALVLQLFPAASPENVEQAITSNATLGVLGNTGSGSPNRLLYSKQPPLVANISGPSTIGPNSFCTWYAVHSGGQPPYAYEWRRDGNVVSTSTSYSVYGGQYSGFGLELLVTDGVGRTGFSVLLVTIDPNNQEVSCTTRPGAEKRGYLSGYLTRGSRRGS